MPRPPAPARLLLRTLEEATVPLFALDGRRQIVFVNRALANWLGIDAQQLLNRRCDYHATAGDDPLQAACAALCPPPEAFTGQITDGFASRLAAADRPFERRRVRFLSLPSHESADGLLLVVLQPAAATGEEPAETELSADRLHALLLKLRSDLGQRFHASQIIGESAAIRRVRQQVRVAAEARARMLIIGPPGSGREHIARTIHYAQNSSSIGPLIPIACPLVDAEQMQAALAAVIRKQHDSPTDRPPAALLLDVDRLRPDAQQELAGFLHLPKIELHTLATARAPLARLVAKGKFRRDLAYELPTLTVKLPPLAARREDIPLLAQHFLEEDSAAANRQLSGFQPSALELLASLPWPGNIDELAEAVRAACAKAAGPRVLLADLPDWVHLAHDAAAHPPKGEEPIQLDAFLAEIEKELLARALKKTRGNKSKAAVLLGLSRPRLLRRLAQLGLIAPAEAEEPVIFEPLPEE
jgi:transcriptional regulator with PAS, ATPase and Fis domain